MTIDLGGIDKNVKMPPLGFKKLKYPLREDFVMFHIAS